MKNYCLITGASGGIGLEFARVFAKKNGYNLILVARSNDKLESLKKELETRYSVKAVAYSADLTSCVEIEQLHKYVIESNLQVDILVNNAGFGDLCAFLIRNGIVSRR